MIEPLSSQEATKRWEFLRGIQNLKPRKAVETHTSSGDSIQYKSGRRKSYIQASFRDESSHRATVSSTADLAGDPFNCGSLVVLPIHDIVKNEIHRYLDEWKKLENRRIRQRSTTSKLPQAAPNKIHTERNEKLSVAIIRNTDNSNAKASRRTNHGGGWRAMEDRLSLPDGFDYSSKSSVEKTTCKDELVDEEYYGDFVTALEDPTQRLSYHWELSKLFRSIPSCRELETQTRLGHGLQHINRVYQETHNPIKSIPDCYTLARLRMPDRHGLPRSFRSFSHYKIRRRLQNQSSYSDKTTIILEFWRKVPKQLASSGCHRMVMEFLSSQTLWDVHLIVTHMAEDDLWMASQDDIDSTHDSSIQTENIFTKCSEGNDMLQRKKDSTLRKSQKRLSGCFYIESTFYIAGSVNYAKPIADWINGRASNHSTPIRRGFLGINPSDSINHFKEMKRTKLSEVPFRPNIRYYHACHGDFETTILLVDRILVHQERFQNENENNVYPLIHDVWAPPRLPAVTLCDACQLYQSIFKTSTDCKITDGGPRSLCQECCRDLNVLKTEQDSVRIYRQWYDQTNISRTMVSA